MSRYSTACHEAGHLVAAALLGHELVGGSIELGALEVGIERNINGLACWRARSDTPVDSGALYGGLFDASIEVRAELEATLAVTLAGPACALAYGCDPPLGYHAPDPDETHAIGVLERRRLLPEEARAKFEDPSDWESDFVESHKVASFLCATPTTMHSHLFLSWFRSEVDAWVLSQRFRRPVMRVVRVLFERGELGGEEIEALINNSDGEVAAHAA